MVYAAAAATLDPLGHCAGPGTKSVSWCCRDTASCATAQTFVITFLCLIPDLWNLKVVSSLTDMHVCVQYLPQNFWLFFFFWISLAKDLSILLIFSPRELAFGFMNFF